MMYIGVKIYNFVWQSMLFVYTLAFKIPSSFLHQPQAMVNIMEIWVLFKNFVLIRLEQFHKWNTCSHTFVDIFNTEFSLMDVTDKKFS